MRDSRPLLLDTLFEDANSLRKIQQRAIALIKLNRAVKALLPKQAQQFCRVANVRQGILVLEVANANWLTRLRYEQQTLISALRSEILPSLVSINIKINPQLNIDVKGDEKSVQHCITEKRTNEIPKHLLSTQSADHLIQLATKSTGKLKEKLERLAALAGERNQRHES